MCIGICVCVIKKVTIFLQMMVAIHGELLVVACDFCACAARAVCNLTICSTTAFWLNISVFSTIT